MLRQISVSDIDGFRYWRDNDLPVESLRARLLRTEAPSEQMAVGTLLHEVLQYGEPGELNGVESPSGLVLRFDLSAEIALPEIREQFLSKRYRIDGHEIEMRGKVDAMTESTVEDHKTSTNPDLEYLLDTMQWRLYLDMADRERFRWNVFSLLKPTKKEPNVWRVTGLEVLEQWRYPGMERDCLDAIAEFTSAVDRAVPEYWSQPWKRRKAA